jgi:hypothetical protein
MKQTYEKPNMITEKTEIGSLAANGSQAGLPVQDLEPNYGLCCP